MFSQWEVLCDTRGKENKSDFVSLVHKQEFPDQRMEDSFPFGDEHGIFYLQSGDGHIKSAQFDISTSISLLTK